MESQHQQQVDQRTVPIIILGGWSPGPLNYLKRISSSPSFPSRCSVIEPPENMPMPPIPGSWCTDPKVVTMFIVLGGLFYLSLTPFRNIENATMSVIIRSLLVVGIVIWFRFLAAVVVRSSINTSIRIAQKEVVHYDNPENVIMIGFSWGGAVSFFKKNIHLLNLRSSLNKIIALSSCITVGTCGNDGKRTDWSSRSAICSTNSTDDVSSRINCNAKGCSTSNRTIFTVRPKPTKSTAPCRPWIIR